MPRRFERPGRSPWRRRGLWIVFATALVAMYLLDQGYKSAPHSGYAPLDAAWLASTADFPRFWGELEGSRPFHALQDHIPHPTRPFEVAVHERTGVRPTPLRWAVWMGRHATASANADGWGVCVRPGVLVHAGHALRQLLGTRPDAHGVYAFADYHYGWRDGFLILSRSPGFVAASLDANRAGSAGLAPSNGLRVTWRPLDAPGLEVRVQPLESIRIAAIIDGAFTPGDATGHAPAPAWPEPMLLTIGATRGERLAGLRDVMRDWLTTAPGGTHGVQVLEEIWQRWALPPLDAEWDHEVMGVALGVDFAFRAAIVPDVAAVAVFDGIVTAAGPHPLAPWLEALAPIPYEWDGIDGECATLLGDGLSLCLAGAGTPWIATSNEPLMARMAAHRPDTAPVEADVVVELDWRRAATLLRQALVLAARYEWIPGNDMATLEDNWGGWLDALAGMGRMTLEGHTHDGQLHFEGSLTTTDATP